MVLFLIIYLVVGCLITAMEHKIDKHTNDLQQPLYYWGRPALWLISIILTLILPLEDDMEV